MSSGAQKRSESKAQSRSWGDWRVAKWLSVLPFVIFIVLAIVLRPIAQQVSSLALLTSILNTTLIGIPGLIVAYPLAVSSRITWA